MLSTVVKITETTYSSLLQIHPHFNMFLVISTWITSLIL